MSLRSFNEEELRERGIDPSRVPPGQYLTDRFPVLHAGVVPRVDLAEWDFGVDGLVGSPVTWSWEDIQEMPSTAVTIDIHCVTKWSKLDTEWVGVPVTEIWDRIDPSPAATHVVVRAYHGFTANLPIDDLLRPGQPARLPVRRQAPRARPRVSTPPRRAAPLLLEVGQVGPWLHLARRGPARVLGTQRVPHVRRPVPRAALLGRLTSRFSRGPRRGTPASPLRSGPDPCSRTRCGRCSRIPRAGHRPVTAPPLRGSFRSARSRRRHRA